VAEVQWDAAPPTTKTPAVQWDAPTPSGIGDRSWDAASVLDRGIRAMRPPLAQFLNERVVPRNLSLKPFGATPADAILPDSLAGIVLPPLAPAAASKAIPAAISGAGTAGKLALQYGTGWRALRSLLGRAAAPAEAPAAEAAGGGLPSLNWLEKILYPGARPPIELPPSTPPVRRPIWADQPLEAPPTYDVPRPAPSGSAGARPAYAPPAPVATAPPPAAAAAAPSQTYTAAELASLRKQLGLKPSEPFPFRIPPQPIRPSAPPAKWTPEELAPPAPAAPAPLAEPVSKPTYRISTPPPETALNDVRAAAEHARRMRMRDEYDFSHFRQQDWTPPADATVASQPVTSPSALPAARLHANREKPLAPVGDPAQDPEYLRELAAYYARQAARGEH